MRPFFALFLLFILPVSSFSQNLSIDEKADSLLALMTLDEKIGQMTQAERGALENITDIATYSLGSLLSGGGSSPEINNVTEWAKMYDTYQQEALKSRLAIPIIYGIDAVHGHNNVKGAVIFPHNIGLGCTWNTDLVKSVNQITAKEVAATGIDWTFSPCIAVPQNEQWGRTYEGFGESKEIQKIMAAASVQGLQGEDLGLPETILACAKHFVGDGGTTDGTDQGNTEISEALLRDIHMSGYIDAIDANVGSIMASYNSWNDQKLHGHDYLLTDVLKGELGFQGFVISDWKGVDQIDEDYREAVKRGINAGIDMVMVPDRYIYFISILKDLVNTNEVSIARIDDAVKRILKQKFLLNLFEEPLTDLSLLSSVGSAPHREIAKQAVRESLVVLSAKNDVLPLQKNDQKILVAGSLANDLGAQCGGWTISWQGSNGAITEGTNIREAIQNAAGTSEVVYSESGENSSLYDVAVVVIGENPYAEGAGDKTSLHLEVKDVSLIKKLKSEGIPVIAILISGRPMIISEVLPYTDAFIAAWLPGSEGDGVAEILFGDYNPSGKLSHTWPREMSQIPINYGDNVYDPLFSYKHGLTELPSSTTNASFNPYAAHLDESGAKILVTLTDHITSFTYDVGDFSVQLNGEDVSDLMNEVIVSENDNSILELHFNSPINSESSSILISFIGDGIFSSSIPLSHFENFYVYDGSIDYGVAKSIPGRIEAEDFVAMAGVGVESTTDLGGGQNVGWIDSGDWMEYYIDVTTSGEYELGARMAGYNPATLSFNFGDEVFASIGFTPTDGWQSWNTFSTNVFLEEGTYVMRASTNSNAFNINYFDFLLTNPVLGFREEQRPMEDIKLYPNPIEHEFSLEFINESNGLVRIGLYDMNGFLVEELLNENLTKGDHTFKFSLDQNLQMGMYIVEIKNYNKRYFKKLLKN